MNRASRFLLVLGASPVLFCACAIPFVSPASSSAQAKPTGTFGHEAPMVSNAGGAAVALLPDGRLLAAGGFAPSGNITDAEIYDPLHNTWSALPSMPAARGGHTATVLPDGSVLVAGGTSALGDPLATAVLFQAGGSWTPTRPMSAPRFGHRALTLNDGRVMLVGGLSEQPSSGQITPPVRTIDIFDPSTRRFTLAAPAPAVMQGAMFVSLPDGRILMAGGEDPEHAATPGAWLFDPKANTWSAARPMPVPRAYGYATTLTNGTVLVAGGYQPQAQAPPQPLASAFLYDPVHNAWSKIADAPSTIGQVFGGAALLRDGRALAFAVDFSGGPTADLTAVFYDPATGAWSTGSPISVTPTGGSSPIVLQSGKVLLLLDSKSLVFDPQATVPAPPQGPVHPLASPRLTPWLVLFAALLVLTLGAQYGQAQFRSRRRPDATLKT